MANSGCVRTLAATVALMWLCPFCRASDHDSEIHEDCLSFNLDSVSVELDGKTWKIVDGNHSMFAFGNQEPQARRALAIIHFYRMDSVCYAGRPHPPMIYLLASGKAPVGSMPGEQCESFDASQIALSQSGEFWRILSGGSVLFDFGNKERGARQGILALHHYEFSFQCIVGSTGSSFRYLRRRERGD